MKIAAIALAILALISGLVAAFYWYKSTLPKIKNMNPTSKDSAFLALGLINGFIQAYNEAAEFNKKAARWTAATAVLGALSAVAGALAS